MRIKDRLPLPNDINDMEKGIIYKNKWGGSCVLHDCNGCGKPLVVAIKRGQLENTRCHKCANSTLEKRGKQSKLQKGVAMKDNDRVHLSKFMKEKCKNDSSWIEHLKDIANKPCSEATKKKLKISNQNQSHSPEQDIAHSIRMKDKFKDKKWKEDQLNKMRNGINNMPKESENLRRDKISIASKGRWSDPEYKDNTIDAIFKGLHAKPTKAEALLDVILQENFAGQWIYNGDNSQGFKIDGKIPDFISPQFYKNKVIELFGYHHCPALNNNVPLHGTEKGRIELFKQYGYHCLIVWQPELKDIDHVVEKVKTFMGAS